MKIFAFGDIHARDSKPRYRSDDYEDTLFGKIKWGIDLAIEKQCEHIILPGDIFETHRASNNVIWKLIKLMLFDDSNSFDNFLGVIGNHDAPFHNLLSTNCPINILRAAGAFLLLHKDIVYKSGEVDFYGASWGEDIPKIKDENAFNVLVIHKMIIGEDKLWEGQENYVTARTLLAKNKFDLIISGDNHQTFVSEYKGKTLLNMGSLGRMTAAQIDHKPTVAIYNTDTRNYELFEVPIKPASEVFNLEEIKYKKEVAQENAKIKEYINILSNDGEKQEWNYIDNLHNFMYSANTNDAVKEIVLSTLEED